MNGKIRRINKELRAMRSAFHIQYSLPNQAYFVMFGDAVARIFNRAEDVVDFMDITCGMRRLRERKYDQAKNY